jgi:hypothetical protein
MVTIPENPVTTADLIAWYNTCEELTRIKAREMLLRKKIFGHYFPDPQEGTNTSPPLEDGAVIKGVHKINRSVDEAALKVLTPEFQKNKIKVDELITYKPDLSIKEYRKLTAEEQKLFDQCLIVKPGTPDLDIVVPKKK